MTDCTYCGCAVEAHDPVYVTSDDPRENGTDEADAYCNYGCLAAHVDEAGLAVGSVCRVDLPAE